MSAMKDLLEEIAKALVDNPDDVSVQEVEGEQTTVLELRVKEQRSGKLLLQKRYTGRAPAPGGPSSAVPAFGKALAGIFERFVADVASAR